jgi:integrase
MLSLVDRFLRDHEEQLSKTSIKSMASPMRQFARWWDKKRKSPSSLTVPDVYSFLHDPDGLRLSLRGSDGGAVSNVSYNRKLNNLKMFVRWLVETRVVRDKEVLLQFRRALRKPGSVTPKRRLSMGLIMDAVTSCTDPWERWVSAFAFLSMGREGELLNTRMSDFNLERMRIMWARPKVGDYDDNLPILGQLEKEYLRWRETYRELCPGADVTGFAYAIPRRKVTAHGRVRTYDPDRHPVNIGHVIKKSTARALGVPPSSLKNQAAHIARRSGARALYDQLRDTGVEDPIRIVMTMLGHTVQGTTEHYIGIRDDRERRDIVLAGSDLMNFEEANVIQLHEVR